jgi:hypothetical protein
MTAHRRRVACAILIALWGGAVPVAHAATTWTPQHPAGKAIDPQTTKESQFWPILLERLCTHASGQPRADRPGTCADDPNAAGKLPADPATALSLISTFLDDQILGAVQVREQKARIVSLENQTLESLLSQIQPANDATPGTQGTPAQTDAVASVQPVSQAAVNAALAGTRGGERVLASIALNPAGIFTTSTNDPAAQEAGSKAIRLSDVSLIVPVNPSGTTTGGSGLGSFDYLGVRLRVNATSLLQDALYPLAQQAVKKTFHDALLAEKSASDKIEPLLASFDPSGCAASYLGGKSPAIQCAGNISSADAFAIQIAAATACAEAITTGVPDKIENACGQPLDVFNASRKAEAAVHGALATLRDQHDASYIGLDARYEFGDPTFSGLPISRGSHLLAALALGHRFLGDDRQRTRHGFFGLKGRIGYQLTSLNDNMDRTNSLDFAVGIEAGVINNLQVLKLSVGAEGRHTWAIVPTAADTNFVDVKVGLDIPQSDGTRLGALLSLPADGGHGATLSLVGNWSALTGALSPK